jgi:hypothetical protein
MNKYNKRIEVILKEYYDNEYKNIRKKWIDVICENNKVTKDILDSYFKEIFNVIFDKNGDILYS